MNRRLQRREPRYDEQESYYFTQINPPFSLGSVE
jgi:hypothetical protein